MIIIIRRSGDAGKVKRKNEEESADWREGAKTNKLSEDKSRQGRRGHQED